MNEQADVLLIGGSSSKSSPSSSQGRQRDTIDDDDEQLIKKTKLYKKNCLWNIQKLNSVQPSGNGFKNKKKMNQESHQEYFCFLDELFYYDQ